MGLNLLSASPSTMLHLWIKQVKPTQTDHPDSRHWGVWDKPQLPGDTPRGYSTSFTCHHVSVGTLPHCQSSSPAHPRRGSRVAGWTWASSPTPALSATGHTHTESRNLRQLKILLRVKRTPTTAQKFHMKTCLFLKKPGKSLSKCSAESPCGVAGPRVSPPLPLPSASPSLREELRMELFSFSLLLVKLWSIQPILVYQPYSYLKRACQFIINSSNYIIAVKRHKWDWECTAAGVRDLFGPSLC